MKTEKEIADILERIDTYSSEFLAMTYEQTWEEALMWVLELDDLEKIEPPVK